MKLALSISILLMLCRSSSAQTFQWAKGFGSNLLDNVLAIAVDHNGNVYTTGGFQSTCDFDPGLGIHNLTSIGNNDIYITKLDSNGNFIWALQFGSPNFDMGSTISTDPYGNIIIGGYFESMIDFDPGPAVLNLANGFFILKLDANGNFIWAKEINGGQCNVESIGHDIFGNIYFTGYFMGFVDFDPGVGNYTLSNIGGWLMDDNIFVLKLDSSGNFLWVRELGAQGSTDEEAHCLTIDNVGNVYTTDISILPQILTPVLLFIISVLWRRLMLLFLNLI